MAPHRLKACLPFDSAHGPQRKSRGGGQACATVRAQLPTKRAAPAKERRDAKDAAAKNAKRRPCAFQEGSPEEAHRGAAAARQGGPGVTGTSRLRGAGRRPPKGLRSAASAGALARRRVAFDAPASLWWAFAPGEKACVAFAALWSWLLQFCSGEHSACPPGRAFPPRPPLSPQPRRGTRTRLAHKPARCGRQVTADEIFKRCGGG
jgi:hypothetical protein